MFKKLFLYLIIPFFVILPTSINIIFFDIKHSVILFTTVSLFYIWPEKDSIKRRKKMFSLLLYFAVVVLNFSNIIEFKERLPDINQFLMGNIRPMIVTLLSGVSIVLSVWLTYFVLLYLAFGKIFGLFYIFRFDQITPTKTMIRYAATFVVVVCMSISSIMAKLEMMLPLFITGVYYTAANYYESLNPEKRERNRLRELKDEQILKWKEEYKNAKNRTTILDPSNNKYSISDKNLKKYEELLSSGKIDNEVFEAIIDVNRFERDYFLNPTIEKESIFFSYGVLLNYEDINESFYKGVTIVSELSEGRKDLIPYQKKTYESEFISNKFITHKAARKNLEIIGKNCSKLLNKRLHWFVNPEKFKEDDVEWERGFENFKKEMKTESNFEKKGN